MNQLLPIPLSALPVMNVGLSKLAMSGYPDRIHVLLHASCGDCGTGLAMVIQPMSKTTCDQWAKIGTSRFWANLKHQTLKGLCFVMKLLQTWNDENGLVEKQYDFMRC